MGQPFIGFAWKRFPRFKIIARNLDKLTTSSVAIFDQRIPLAKNFKLPYRQTNLCRENMKRNSQIEKECFVYDRRNVSVLKNLFITYKVDLFSTINGVVIILQLNLGYRFKLISFVRFIIINLFQSIFYNCHYRCHS